MKTDGSIGFWSYTHRDDQIENGRIRRLAAAIANEYELLTAERLGIFVDNSAIEWGDEWKAAIDGALARTAFFIPIVTPLYLRSEQCRREFIEFAGRAASADVRELVLPILYADTPAVADYENEDEVARLVREIQYEDWRQLRLAAEDSPEYRSALHKLASRLASITAQISERPVPEPDESDIADSAGFLDKVAEAEEATASWADTLLDLTVEVEKLGELAESTTARLKTNDTRGAGARGRLVVLNQFAHEISPQAERIDLLGREFGRAVIDANPGIVALIEAGSSPDLPVDDRAQAESFFRSLRELAGAAATGVAGLETLSKSIVQVQSISRVVRAPLRRINKGLSAIVDAETVLRGWARLTETAP